MARLTISTANTLWCYPRTDSHIFTEVTFLYTLSGVIVNGKYSGNDRTTRPTYSYAVRVDDGDLPYTNGVLLIISLVGD